jgi:hypothetical protein
MSATHVSSMSSQSTIVIRRMNTHVALYVRDAVWCGTVCNVIDATAISDSIRRAISE